MKEFMQNTMLAIGFAWKKGFGLGFRVHGMWKCTKGFVAHVDFANIEFVLSLQYLGVCTCGEVKDAA